MKTHTIIVLLSAVGLLMTPFRLAAQTLPYENDYAFGLDVSFTKQHEDNGRKYYDTDGTEKRPLQIFRDTDTTGVAL